jgi:hypothetical protein
LGTGYVKLNKRGLIIFFVAAFFGLILMLISFFLDTEALFNRVVAANITGGYNLGLGGSASKATIAAEENLFSLRCPMMITSQDDTVIQAKVSNPTDKEAIRIFEMNISNGYGKDQTKEIMPISPGEVKTLQWEISNDQAMYGSLITARAFLHPYKELPSLGGTCGILALDIPYLTGAQLVWSWIALSVTGMVIGTLVFVRHNQPLTIKRRKWMISLLIVTGTVTAGLLLTFLEFWYVTFLISVVTFFMVPAVFLDLYVNH